MEAEVAHAGFAKKNVAIEQNGATGQRIRISCNERSKGDEWPRRDSAPIGGGTRRIGQGHDRLDDFESNGISGAQSVSMEQPFSLAGETALITGGGTGLGLGMARCFVRAGARVALVGRRKDVLKKAANELGEAATWEAHDILQLDRAASLISRLRDRVGPVTILVNNAGIHIKKSAVDLSVDEFQSVLQTHVVAAFSLTRAVLPEMIERRHGNILFSASMASLIGLPMVAAYAAAKAGYLGLTRSLASEVSQYGVRVNAIAPGWIESDMMRSALNGDPERGSKVLGRTPMNRFGEPEDIGWAATYLCSPAARFITGIVLPVDGGASIGF